MRDILVTAVILASLPVIVAQPYIGIYVWSWLGYMNPQRLTWGFAYDFPFAEMVAIATLAGLLFSREPKRIPWTRESVVLLIFVAWMFFTVFFAIHSGAAWVKWDKVWKVELFVFLTMMLITTPERLKLLIWVIALSLGFYGVKGGIFTISTGGVHQVLGPEGTFIGNRGDIGTALNMTIPLLRFLQLNSRSRWVRAGLTVAIVLTCFAVIGTHSRGAFLGLAAVLFMLILKTRRKLFFAVVLGATAYGVLSFMPAEWGERMQTIETYHQDASAMGRIEAWKGAIALANEYPLVGGGLNSTAGFRAAHSIYFQVLGDQGYVGLGLFLLLGFLTWRSASQIRKKVGKDPNLRWMGDLAAMIQVSLVGYGVGGAFLSLAYFDLTYHLVAIIVLCKTMLLQQQAKAGVASRRATAPSVGEPQPVAEVMGRRR